MTLKAICSGSYNNSSGSSSRKINSSQSANITNKKK